MKKRKFIFSALTGIILVSSCGNGTNENMDQNNMDTISSDMGMQQDTSMQDTSSSIQYRNINTAKSSNGAFPTTR